MAFSFARAKGKNVGGPVISGVKAVDQLVKLAFSAAKATVTGESQTRSVPLMPTIRTKFARCSLNMPRNAKKNVGSVSNCIENAAMLGKGGGKVVKF